MIYTDNIIDSIDIINTTTISSEMNVIEALTESIDKSFVIMENYENDDLSSFSIFQEGKILDTVKKESKKDSNKLITILKFIPRVISALIETLKPSKKRKKKFELFKRNMGKINSMSLTEKRRKVKELNRKFNGEAECYLDEKSGKIKFKHNSTGLIAKLALDYALLMNTYKLVKKIKEEFDPLNPSKINEFIDNCDRIIHGDKNVSKLDIFDGGLEALSELTSTFFSVSGEITLILAQINTRTNDMIKKDMIKDIPNENKQKTIAAINKLTGKLTKINALITAALGVVDNILDVGNVGSDTAHVISNAVDINEEALDELEREYPKRDEETAKEYYERLGKMLSAKIKEIKGRRKSALKEQQDAAKREARERRQSRRQEGYSGDQTDDDDD